VALLGLLLAPQRASAQLDPLLYIKRTNSPSPTATGKPNVLIAVDTANRMQRDLNGDYRDDNIYKYADPPLVWETALGISPGVNVDTRYRRKYVGLINTDTSATGDRFSADHIEITGDRQGSLYSLFDYHTRISIARQGLIEAINRNSGVVRFGLLKTRQSAPAFVTPASADAWKWNINEGSVTVTNPSSLQQTVVGDWGSSGKWKITRPVVGAINGAIAGPVVPLVKGDANADSTVVATSILNILNQATGASATALTPAGRDQFNVVDAPIDTMLDDLRTEAARLIGLDTECRNTVAVLVVGGGQGNTSAGNVLTKAATFLNVSGHRVPIHVVALAPITAADRTQLQTIASTTGGQYTEITLSAVETSTMIGPGKFVPDFVRAVNFAVSQAFVDQATFDLPPDGSHPYGFETNHQVTSPIVGTVNLTGAKDINGTALPNSSIIHPVTGTEIPQRSNVMLTTGFTLPGFTAKLQAVRTYRPVEDSSKSVGYKFVSDGTKLWTASAPAAASRNIYTALPDGTVVPFTSANAVLLSPYLKQSAANSATLIDFIRAQPLGAVVDSTPALLDPPSLDPPPDADYPAFAAANRDRRSMVWVGANDGMLHAIDARLGKEVWAFIPFNLLPKLNTLRSGQPVGEFRFFVDGSPKVADVKVGGAWHTYLVMGEGPGGTFYQTFDVTLANMASTVNPESDSISDVLSYFSSAASVPLKWTFPLYSHFNVSTGAWGELAITATSVEKTVGETWSDPAIGQIGTASSPYVVLTGSGFLKYTTQNSRGVTSAGATFYLLDVGTGAVYDSNTVPNDGKGETLDNCAAFNDCRQQKNALQADPVATGPSDSRFITKAYMGDLDGNIWRFDVALNGSGAPVIQTRLNLFTIGGGSGGKGKGGGGTASDHPVFSSMATVNIGGTQQYLFVGTGSDLLPSNSISGVQYSMLVILDQGSSGTQTAQILLEAVDGANGEEKVTSFPAVAGDIVFFATTTYKTVACAKPDANLYGFTFIGGPAYDTNNDSKLTSSDSTKIQKTVGARATSPFIVDQHLVFGAGNTVETFGDPQDFNNGVGQAGVRILSWREVR
jgi:hypothetical protein